MNDGKAFDDSLGAVKKTGILVGIAEFPSKSMQGPLSSYTEKAEPAGILLKLGFYVPVNKIYILFESFDESVVE